MSDIIDLIDSEGSAAVDQIIEDSKRLHVVVNGTGVQSATTEDGSLIPSVRKALLDSLYFQTPPLPWKKGSTVTVFNQVYSYTDANGVTEWWYAPSATNSSPVVMQASPVNDAKFRLFLNGSNITYIYAPLNSPDFTGNPRVPTAQKDDASSTIANTQFVQDRVKELKDQLDGSLTGEFKDISVSGNTELQNLHVKGESVLDGDIDASTSTMSLNKLRMFGEGAEIIFEEGGTPPEGITKPTHLTPYTIEAGKTITQQTETDKLTVLGVNDDTTVSTDLQGNSQADYLHITGNSANEATRPQLVVDGIAKFGTIIADNLKADVDGEDIHPNSVTTDMAVTVGTDLTVSGDASVNGTTTVQDLIILGTITGVGFSVDGQDISPNSVKTTEGVSVGTNLDVVGEITAGSIIADSMSVTGEASIQSLQAETIQTGSLEVTGAFATGSVQTSRINLTPNNIVVTGTADVQLGNISNVVNLEVTRDLNIANLDVSSIGAFSMNVYIRQDSTGHAVTLADQYTILNPDTQISVAPNSVTILQMSYSGFDGDKVDVAIFVRP